MDKKGTYFFTQRTKYFFVIAITLLPIVSFMLIVFLTSFRPVFKSMEMIVERGFKEIGPIHHLQIALLNAVMPPNDYLIHGSENERQNWERLKTVVGKAFTKAKQGSWSESEHRILLAMKEQWAISRRQGDTLFLVQPHNCVHTDAADAMESFDASVGNISKQLKELIGQVQND